MSSDRPRPATPNIYDGLDGAVGSGVGGGLATNVYCIRIMASYSCLSVFTRSNTRSTAENGPE